MQRRPLNIAVIGMGGCAGDHHDAVAALEAAGECQLLCTCDPCPERFAARQDEWRFAERGAAVHTDYLRMLDAHGADLDVVTVPTPVPLHAEMHRECVERGIACYLEKPPTLFWPELDEMVAVDAAARKRTQVGFNYIVEPDRQAVKQRLVAGEFGRVLRASFRAVVPRASTYFTRASWAGRLMLDGRPVLDCCIGNAVGHYVHNLLFWAGSSGLLAYGRAASMRAEMARAHDIEGPDTVFARAVCEDGVELTVAASHACAGASTGTERVECERATIVRTWGEPFFIEWAEGRSETVPMAPYNVLQGNFRAYFAYVRGESDRPLVTLEDTRPFVEFIDLAYLAANGIATVPEQHVERRPAADGQGEFVAIRGLPAVFDDFFAGGRFPSEQGLAWARAGGAANRQDLPRLLDTARRLAEDRTAERGLAAR